MTTALQLVNRVRRRFREENSTTLTNDMTVLILDLLNEAKRDLLEAYTWDFDYRTDGELLSKARLTAQTVAVNAGSPSITTTIPIASIVGQNAVGRVIITSDASFGDSAIKILSASAGGGFTVLLTGTEWPGSSSATATASVVFDEYVLPSTVRAITSVRHQERDLRLFEIDRDIELDTFATRPHEDTGDAPGAVFVGKRSESTYNSGSVSSGTTGIGIKFDQTPSEALLFTYSYAYRHPDIGAAQDLDGVDASVEDLIVRLAEARGTMSGLGADIQTGAAMEQEVLNRAAALHGNQRRDPNRRVVIGPASFRRGNGFGRFPRNFGSI